MTIKKFKDLVEGDQFKHLNHSLVWTKSKPFTAYGYIKNQNAATYAKPNGPWHYDHVDDEQEVEFVENSE